MRKFVSWLVAGLVVVACVGAVLLKVQKERQTTPKPARSADLVRHVQDRGIDASSARLDELLSLAREYGSKWRPDAKLVEVTVAPRRDGLINLMQPAPAADFLFWSDRADDCLGVMFRSGGEIRPYEHAEPDSKRELPSKLLDITEALAQASADGWKQNVNRAVLSWHESRTYGGRYAWTIVGDGSVADDRVYCIDATTGKPFLSMELQENLELPQSGDRTWIGAGATKVLKDPKMKAMWQAVEINAGGASVMVPLRPYLDAERPKVTAFGADANPKDVPVGPGVRLTTEERRVFKNVFGERALPVGVDPGLVVLDSMSNVDRTAVARAVEVDYRTRSTDASR